MKGLTDLNTLFTTLNEIFRPSVTLSMTFYKTQIILGAFGGPVREHFGPFQAHFRLILGLFHTLVWPILAFFSEFYHF